MRCKALYYLILRNNNFLYHSYTDGSLSVMVNVSLYSLRQKPDLVCKLHIFASYLYFLHSFCKFEIICCFNYVDETIAVTMRTRISSKREVSKEENENCNGEFKIPFPVIKGSLSPVRVDTNTSVDTENSIKDTSVDTVQSGVLSVTNVSTEHTIQPPESWSEIIVEGVTPIVLEVNDSDFLRDGMEKALPKKLRSSTNKLYITCEGPIGGIWYYESIHNLKKQETTFPSLIRKHIESIKNKSQVNLYVFAAEVVSALSPLQDIAQIILIDTRSKKQKIE